MALARARLPTRNIRSEPASGAQRTSLLPVEQVGQRQRAQRAGISAQEGAAIQRKEQSIRVSHRDHELRVSIQVEECIAGEEHLAEICPGALVWVRRGTLGVARVLSIEEAPGGAPFI